MSSEETPDILNFVHEADPYSTRRRTNKPQYQPLLEELLKFARARAEGKHALGLSWFLKDGMRLVNAHRVEQGQEPMAMLSEAPLARWLGENHPELREAFRR